MNTLSVRQFQNALLNACAVIIDSEPLLTQIDSVIGDGDHGTGMKDGFTALQETLLQNQYPDFYSLTRATGTTLVKAMGGASGVIFGTLFIAGHDGVRGKTSLDADALIAFFDKGAASIATRGRTAPGDKTMLDALLAAVASMRKARETTCDIGVALSAAYSGALKGVEATKNMVSRKGRSRNFREKTLGVPDPGAVSLSLIFKGLCESVNGLRGCGSTAAGFCLT